MHSANLDLLFRGNEIEIAGFDVLRKYELDVAAGEACALAAKPSDTYRELLSCTNCLEFHEATV